MGAGLRRDGRRASLRAAGGEGARVFGYERLPVPGRRVGGELPSESPTSRKKGGSEPRPDENPDRRPAEREVRCEEVKP